MTLNINFFFTSPVEVVRVTPKNLEEVAEWCGGKVAKVESRKVKGRIDSYVWVPTPDGAKISWAFPGMFITKRLAVTENNELKETFSVFRKDYFNKNYFEDPTVALEDTWGRFQKERNEAARRARTVTIELPEGADVEAAKAEINRLVAPQPVDVVQVTVPLVDLDNVDKVLDAIDDNLTKMEKAMDDFEAANPPSMVDQRDELIAEAVEAEVRNEMLTNDPRLAEPGDTGTPADNDPAR